MKAEFKNAPIVSILGENPDTTCGEADIINSKHGPGKFTGVMVIRSLKYGKIKFPDGIYIGDFDEDSNMRFGTFTFKDGKVASGFFEDGELRNGTISFPDGRVFYAKERFDEDGTYDGALFADGTWSQGTYDAESFEIEYGWRFDENGNGNKIG